METLLDLSILMIEEVTGWLKDIDDCNELSPLETVTIGGKLLFTEDLPEEMEEGGDFGFVECPLVQATQEGTLGTQLMVASLVSARPPATT